jgi:hypothetical protein
MPDAPRIKPRPKPGPVALDRLQAVVLAGGTSSGNPLTKFDARASLKFGASYRLIDFPMANIINSGLKRAFVLTQFNSYTLNQHVQAAYPPEVFGFGSQGYARAPTSASPATTAPPAPSISTRPNVPRTEEIEIENRLTQRVNREMLIVSATGGNRTVGERRPRVRDGSRGCGERDFLTDFFFIAKRRRRARGLGRVFRRRPKRD